jgi:hypothetical protein
LSVRRFSALAIGTNGVFHKNAMIGFLIDEAEPLSMLKK